jgi:hypothetical protein
MSAKRFSEPVALSAPAAATASEAGPRLHRAEPSDHPMRNPGVPLDLDVVRAIRVNRSAVERRAATIELRAPNGDVLAQTYVRAGESYVVPAGIAYRIVDAR